MPTGMSGKRHLYALTAALSALYRVSAPGLLPCLLSTPCNALVTEVSAKDVASPSHWEFTQSCIHHKAQILSLKHLCQTNSCMLIDPCNDVAQPDSCHLSAQCAHRPSHST